MAEDELDEDEAVATDEPDNTEEGAEGTDTPPESTPPAEPEKPQTPDASVPRARFNEIKDERNSYRDELHQKDIQIAKLEGAANARSTAPAEAPVPPAFDMNAALEKQADALMDNDKKAYAAITRQINDHNMSQIVPEPAPVPDARTDENVQYDYAVGKMNDIQRAATQAHPVLDKNAPEYSQSTVDDVLGWYEVNMQKGLYPDVAMDAALRKVVEGYGANGSDTPSVDVEAEARARADAINGQPSRQAGGGAGEAPGAKEKLDNWDELPEKERKAMLYGRGK